VAKLPGFKEEIHQELYDTLLRGVGASTVAAKTKLFRALNTGNPELTNMQEGGRLSNEEVLLALSLRFYVQFGTPDRYREMEDGIMWTFLVGNKPMLGPLPLFCAPAGGGMHGFDVGNNAHVISNGVPSWNGILKFAKPIEIEKNQHFSVDVEFYDFASLDGATPLIDPRANLNADLDLKIIKCFLGGVLKRSVQ